MRFNNFLPILDWLKGDIGIGFTVGVMLIPQGMAYASIPEKLKFYVLVLKDL